MVNDVKSMSLTRPGIECLNKKQIYLKRKEKRIFKICLFSFLIFGICCLTFFYFTTTANGRNKKEDVSNERSELFLNSSEIGLLRDLVNKYRRDKIKGQEKQGEISNKLGNETEEDRKGENSTTENGAGSSAEQSKWDDSLMERYKRFVGEASEENREELAKMLRELLKKKFDEKNAKEGESRDVIGNNTSLSTNRVSENIEMYDDEDEQLENMLDNIKYAAKFLKFMKKYNKNYKNMNEQMEKYENFKVNYRKIKEHNKKKKDITYKKKVNHFGDYSKKDLKNYFKKLLPIQDNLKEKYVIPFKSNIKTEENKLGKDNNSSDSSNSSSSDNDILNTLPENLDYREKGIVHDPKDQGACGSCWAFASVGNIECMYAKNNNNTILTLSEQEIVDCSKLNFGCDGGHPFYSFIYAIENGVCLNEEYKYRAIDDLFCLNYRCGKKVTLSSVGGVKENELILALNEVGPVSVNVGVTDDFAFYAGGIFNGTCTEELNHSVLLVGYGQVQRGNIFQTKSKNHGKNHQSSIQKYGENQTENNDDDILYYWIIKNSWSKLWGENGFMRISRNKEGNNVFCGIGVEVFYPIL
ncbi:cysteine proteinase, putative [Plasmodium ovale]|uniref:Cysteine proteinase n=2 Tax=Plasmodium ovale TaxID=36330 RepID=A0A1A8W5U9_PLAOA|nr:cysteine proteinase precursor [Plasmodium ovale curtisi]SBS96946.1 cysteine proteinase precursor [Plasmodium ovale curtisi]SCP05702.1 cysteine proteinase, putative [Plasmodium ovale]